MTISELYERFSQAKEWQRLAAVMRGKVRDIILRPHGETDADSVTRETLKGWLSESKRPMEDTVPTESVINHMMIWSKRWREQSYKSLGADSNNVAPAPSLLNPVQKEVGKKAETLRPKPVKKAKTKPNVAKSATKRKNTAEIATKKPKKPIIKVKEEKPKPVSKCHTKPETKYATRHPEHMDALEDYADKHNINIYDSENPHGGRRSTGTIYHDNASKGYDATGKRVFKDCWRAEIMIAGQRYRHRSKDRDDCVAWLKAVKQGKIKPTDNKADWWRMEQRKDESVRIDELIVSAAEEANIVYEYRQTGDTAILYDYCIKALLPHMVYYCAHTLHLGQDRSLTCSRQAVGLILTKIVGGRPVTNITFTCKRMLRTYKNRGDFWYYDKAPEQVKLMVNRIDISALAELYKVTKDRRI